jgi:hypothetical protein
MKKKKILLDSLATNLSFSSEQQSCIKSALNLVVPKFKFQIIVDEFNKENSLIKPLKTKNTHHKTINDFSYMPPAMLSPSLMIENFDKQIVFEAESLTHVASIMPKAVSSEQISEVRAKIIDSFRERVTKDLVKSIQSLRKSSRFSDALIYPFLTFMDPQVYVDLLMQQVIRLAQNSKYFSEPVRDISFNLGNALETKYLHFLMSKNGDIDKVNSRLFRKCFQFKSIKKS